MSWKCASILLVALITVVCGTMGHKISSSSKSLPSGMQMPNSPLGETSQLDIRVIEKTLHSWVQTSKEDFERGSYENVDLSTIPGSIILAGPRAENVRLHPTADAFTDLRDAPEVNCGSAPWIGVNAAGGYRSPLGYRVSEGTFLKFDLRGISGTVNRCWFGAYAYTVWWRATCDAALFAFGTEWKEQEITGLNAPWGTLGERVSSIVSGTADPNDVENNGELTVEFQEENLGSWWVHEVDNQYVQNFLGKEIGFYYCYPYRARAVHYGQFYYSKEHPDENLRPHLLLSLTIAPTRGVFTSEIFDGGGGG